MTEAQESLVRSAFKIGGTVLVALGALKPELMPAWIDALTMAVGAGVAIYGLIKSHQVHA